MKKADYYKVDTSICNKTRTNKRAGKPFAVTCLHGCRHSANADEQRDAGQK